MGILDRGNAAESRWESMAAQRPDHEAGGGLLISWGQEHKYKRLRGLAM